MAEYDKEIVSLAQQILGQRQPKSDPPPAEPEAQQQAPEVTVEARPERTDVPEGKLAQQVLGQHQSRSELPPAEPKARQQAPGVTVEARPDPTDVPKGKETKTAAELAQMIEADLAKHPQCPKGLQVTVYGTTLWRAMLMIKPAAGPVRNPQEWRDLTEELAERLRKRYDLAWR